MTNETINAGLIDVSCSRCGRSMGCRIPISGGMTCPRCRTPFSADALQTIVGKCEAAINAPGAEFDGATDGQLRAIIDGRIKVENTDTEFCQRAVAELARRKAS